MGNSVISTVHLEHEVEGQQEAIEAGRKLVGKVILDVQEPIHATDLILEVNGKERTTAPHEDMEGGEIASKHCFFRADVVLYQKDGGGDDENDDHDDENENDQQQQQQQLIAPNQYIFPFSIPLPKSLPCSRSFYDADNNGSFRIDYNIKLKTNNLGQERFPNIRAFQVSTAPRRHLADPVPCLLQPEPIDVEELGIPGGKGRIFFGAHVRDTKASRNNHLEVSLACRNQSSCRIKKVMVTLEEEYFWTSGSRGGYGKVSLIELDNVAKLPGFMLIGYHPSEIDDLIGNDEIVARKMFKDLKNKRNNLQLEIPYHAKESYTGLVVKISHALKLTLITEDVTTGAGGAGAGVDVYPTMTVPIQIGGDPPRTMMAAPTSGSSIHSRSDHVLAAAAAKPRKKFPLATASPSNVVVGHSAGILDNDDSVSEPIPPQPSSSSSTDPAFQEFLDELVSSISDYEFVDDKLKDLEWAILLASLSPAEFGQIIGHVNLDFEQPRVAALLARNFGGDFTCAHCAAGLQNTSTVFRSNIVEGLLTYCSDISENNFEIRENLSDFEQVIVALHALDVKENPTAAAAPPPPPPIRASPPSTGSSSRDRSSRKGASPSTTPGGGSRHNQVQKSPVQPQKRRSTGSSRHRRSVEGLTIEADPSKPNLLDICIGNNQHTGTKEFYHFVKYVVTSSVQQEFSPPMFRRIKRKFKDRRFLIHSTTGSDAEWREVTNRELIDFIGGSYDAERIKQQQSEDNNNMNSRNKAKNTRGGGYLQDTSDEWSVALSIHSYVSGLANDAEDDENLGPMSIDICFGKASHPGNSTLVAVIRRLLPEFQNVPWGPSVYRAIKAKLKGRRFFVPNEENGWSEATSDERHVGIETYYEHLAKAEEKHAAATPKAPAIKSSSSSPVPTPKSPGVKSSPMRPEKKRLTLDDSLPQLEDVEDLDALSMAEMRDMRNSKGELIRKHAPSEEKRSSSRALTNGRPAFDKRNSKGQVVQKHRPLEEKRPSIKLAPPEDSKRPMAKPASMNGRAAFERRNSRGQIIHKHAPMAERADPNRQLLKSPTIPERKTVGGPPPKTDARPKFVMNKNSAVYRAKKKAMSMKHPREFDVCFGDDNHPGTNAFHLAVLDAIQQFRNTPWSASINKFIRAHLKGRRVFIRPHENLPWREANERERAEASRKYFEAARKKLKGPS